MTTRTDGTAARRASGALAALCVAALVALTAAVALVRPDPAGAGTAGRSAHANYLLRCSGCHGIEGDGVVAAGIPPFPGFIDAFVADEEGRTYVTHVPGVVASSLSDAEIAAVLNYIVDRWGSPEAAPPFTGDEVARRRALPVDDVVVLRRGIVARLSAQGIPVADYPWP